MFFLFHVQEIATRLQNNELPCVFQKHTPRNMHFNDYRHSWLCVNKRGLFHYNQCWGIAAFKSCSSGKLQKKNTKLYPCCSCVCRYILISRGKKMLGGIHPIMLCMAPLLHNRVATRQTLSGEWDCI